MHELGITENLIELVLEQAQGAKVGRVTLEVGQLSAILPDSIRFCFDVCCQDTPLAGAILEIIEIPGLGVCQNCQAEQLMELPWGICDRCGSRQLQIIQGQELILKTLELESICV